MIIEKSTGKINPESYEAIAILAYEAKPESVSLEVLPEKMRGFCRQYFVNTNFRAKQGAVSIVPVDGAATHFVVVAGLGKKKDKCLDSVRQASFSAVRFAAENGCKTVAIFADNAKEKAVSRAAAEGAALSAYRFNKYISPDKDDRFKVPEKVVCVGADEDGLKEGQALGGAQLFTRETANEPANIINPRSLAARALALADELGLECEIWNEERISNEKMGAYYAVARGSANPPRFIRVTYSPKGKCKGHAVLVGKGLTFDSGGLDIKPADFMTTMKGDKSGACAVLGAIKAAAELALQWKVTALIAAAENMPGGNSYRPDDILRARNGKTIEVNNTDAEGRLTLADALCFASELKPDFIVDIATLTGACAVALGPNTAGLFANDDKLGERIESAAKVSGERVWRMPMDDTLLRKSLKSSFADVVNCGERYGGAITAAMFLEEFVEKDIPWAHIDMAAVDFIKNPYGYYVKGASGYGARLLASLIMEL